MPRLVSTCNRRSWGVMLVVDGCNRGKPASVAGARASLCTGVLHCLLTATECVQRQASAASSCWYTSLLRPYSKQAAALQQMQSGTWPVLATHGSQAST